MQRKLLKVSNKMTVASTDSSEVMEVGSGTGRSILLSLFLSCWGSAGQQGGHLEGDEKTVTRESGSSESQALAVDGSM